MKAKGFLKKTIWVMVSIATLAVLAWIDWLPTLKGLNRCKREQREYSLQTARLKSLIGRFAFPDEGEKLAFSRTAQQLQESLPMVADDASWLAMVVPALSDRARLDRIENALVLLQAGPGQPLAAPRALSTRAVTGDLQRWLAGPNQGNSRCLQDFTAARKFPWRGVFSGLETIRERRLASRELGVAFTAPLPQLLNFINHVSWGKARLEIVSLRLDLGAASPLVWLICRGNYLVSEPSAWEVKKESGTFGDDLLIDPDSPLLWQKVDPGFAYGAEKKELAPADVWDLD